MFLSLCYYILSIQLILSKKIFLSFVILAKSMPVWVCLNLLCFKGDRLKGKFRQRAKVNYMT
jgi:hypothetical protein